MFECWIWFDGGQIFSLAGALQVSLTNCQANSCYCKTDQLPKCGLPSITDTFEKMCQQVQIFFSKVFVNTVSLWKKFMLWLEVHLNHLLRAFSFPFGFV